MISDQGESEMFLRTLLHQIYEHLVMLFGEEMMAKEKLGTQLSKHRKRIQNIVNTLCDLCDKHQSMLIKVWFNDITTRRVDLLSHT